MTDLNNLVIMGRLTKDLGADERSFGFLPTGTAKGVISIAVNRSKKQGEQWVDEVSYFDVTMFGKMAENLKPYLTKGTQVCIEGYLRQDRWEKDGQKQSRVSIIANNVHLVGNSQNKQSNSNNSVKDSQYNSNVSGEGFPEDCPF